LLRCSITDFESTETMSFWTKGNQSAWLSPPAS
jgi:hypothetical protein